MAVTRYREERTLVRGLRRLPGQSREQFRKNVLLLRRHFERFNVDVSDICQWMMGLRPKDGEVTPATQPLWDFMLEPSDGQGNAQGDPDRMRLLAFRVATGVEHSQSGVRLPLHVQESLRHVAALTSTESARRLILRFQQLEQSHQMILLKSASEWVRTRYSNANENWQRNRPLWEKEKAEWEKEHPALTPDACRKFSDIFKELGIKDKRPRICGWNRLKLPKDNCDYAGERVGGGRHAPLCKFYREFQAGLRREYKKQFPDNALKYLALRKQKGHTQAVVLQQFCAKDRRKSGWFPKAWMTYLQKLNVTEETLIQRYQGQLPHCVKIDNKTGCSFNPHTNDCLEYKKRILKLPESDRELETQYREWRRDYLSGPRKPSFRYPSSRNLPTPKIFGAGYYEADFTRSMLRLRLDDMPRGRFIEFGFKPWPSDYDIQPVSTQITSAHIHFIGTRARVGFRFAVAARPSRLRISQDEIDALRRQYPRAAQDQQFLDHVRPLILDSFAGNPKQELRILTIDLGTSGGAAAAFCGVTLVKSEVLKVIKLDKLYDLLDREDKRSPTSGLGEGHVGRHLEALSKEAAKIAQHRTTWKNPGLRPFDERQLTSHIRWMIRDWVRLNAQQIIEIAERENADLILFESMRGYYPKARDKYDSAQKVRLGFFSYGAIRRKVAEKAVERGMRILTLPYKFSSQICSKCGRKQENRGLKTKKAKRLFKCEHTGCGTELNSDENAARVLAGVFWGTIKLPEKAVVSHT